MRRETLAFALAGVAFGFVAGYMAANWGVVPRPAAAAAAAAGGAAAAARPSPVPTVGFDPDEVKAMESLAARQPGDLAVRVELGNLYMDGGRWDEAARWYREALALDPTRPEVATDLGACLVNSGQPAEGLAEFEKVLGREPGHRNALYNKGVALQKLRRTGEAVAAWEDLLRRHPEDPQLQPLRGRIERMRTAAGSVR